jgi:chromosome partitioning protein
MTNFLVCHSRKGGVGKTTLAYELAYLLDGVLVDLEHDGGSATLKWGYEPEDRIRIPILDALANNRIPKPLKGFGKADLIPGHPLLGIESPDTDVMAEALLKWGAAWEKPWVVVDTHPGAAPHTNGALSIANVVVVPSPLKNSEMTALEKLIAEMADYPLVIVPTMVPAVPNAKYVRSLTAMVKGTPIQVAPPVPEASAVALRSKRMAITSEKRPAKAVAKVDAALRDVAEFVKEYVK